MPLPSSWHRTGHDAINEFADLSQRLVSFRQYTGMELEDITHTITTGLLDV